MTMGEPAGEYFAALSTICTNACSTRTASTKMSGRFESMSSETLWLESRRRRRSSAELTMSWGSIHSCRGRICSRLMRVASSRFWMSLLRRSASSRTTPASAFSRSSFAITGDLLNTVAAPRIDASGVRNSWDTEPISASRNSSVSERIFASLSARATSSRSSVAAASDSTSSTRWRTSSTAHGGTLPRSMAMTPKSAFFCETRRTSQMSPAPSSTVVASVRPARTSAIAVGDRPEQHHLALDQAREMLLDREIDVGGRRRRCQAAREGIEITHVLFAFAGNLGMLLHGVCEVARHHGNDHEQQQIENLVRTGEVEAVVRREEKISRPQHPGDGGDQRRHQAEMPPGEQHREQIDDGAPAHVERLDQHVGNERGRGHQHQGKGAAAQFTSNRFHSNQGSSSGAGNRRD